MPTPPLPGPPSIQITTTGLFDSASGGTKMTQHSTISVLIERDTAGVFSVFALETLALMGNPEVPHSVRTWQTVEVVDGAGPIAVGNGEFLLITVGCAFPADTPPDTTFFGLAVVVAQGTDSPILAQVSLQATHRGAPPVFPTIAIEMLPSRALNGIAPGQPGDLKFRFTSTLDRDTIGLFNCNAHGTPFSSPPDKAVLVRAGESIDVSVPVLCFVTTPPQLFSDVQFQYVSDTGTYTLDVVLEVIQERTILRLLIVADGIFNFDVPDPTDKTFTIEAFVNTLKFNRSPQIDIDTAHREGNPKATIGGKFDFAQSIPDLSVYDVIWLFGYDGSNFGQNGLLKFISNDEVQAIARFMDGGGGMFAVGDHDGLGSLMCGTIPRVRSMRKWFAVSDDDPAIPAAAPRNWPAFGPTRADTLQPDKNGSYNFDNQSDDIAQPLAFPGGAVHPILEGPNGPIAFFPDHMHEGEVILPWTLDDEFIINGQTFVEYPSVGGRQEVPVIIATGKVIPGHQTPVEGSKCEQDNFFPDPAVTNENDNLAILCAYDGHKAGVGRVVTDSSFHHYLDLNIIGDPCGVDGKQRGLTTGPVFNDMIAFFTNTALWLAPPIGL